MLQSQSIQHIRSTKPQLVLFLPLAIFEAHMHVACISQVSIRSTESERSGQRHASGRSQASELTSDSLWNAIYGFSSLCELGEMSCPGGRAGPQRSCDSFGSENSFFPGNHWAADNRTGVRRLPCPSEPSQSHTEGS